MTTWEKLAEARIREWMQRDEAVHDARRTAPPPVAPLEVQLLEEITKLYADAAAARDPAEAEALLRRAEATATRLLVVLESTGRPLAAQHFSRLLEELRARHRRV